MDSERLRQIESYKVKLQQLEMEKTKLETELSNVNGKIKEIYKIMTELSDSTYEADMLARVYEQRHKK